MLLWAMSFLVLALFAGLLGFGGMAAASAGIAQTLCLLFLIVFGVILLLSIVAEKKITA
jgi:uncharacterized membrane protein YtjA (UPF0391 family)